MRCALFTTTVTLCATTMAHAQSDRTGRLDGTVTDSVHARALTGVTVQALDVQSPTSRPATATTDKDGRFHIDSLPPGRYVVGFESPLLDSLEIALPPRAVTIAAKQTATVDLALPPATKLRAAVCPGVSLPPETGAIYGRVVSAESENPLAGVVVALSWRELGIDRKALRPVTTERTASVTTDGGGWYVVCGVSTGAWVSMQLQHQGRVGPVLRAQVDDSLGIAIQHLSFSASESRADASSGARADKTEAVALSGTAALSGRVLGVADAPVDRAEVRVRGAAGTTRTDAAGRYSLAQLPAGTQVLEVRRFGYEVSETPIELRSGVTTTNDVRLRRVIARLDSMRVVATRSRYPDFQRRREHGVYGIFLGPEELARQHVAYVSDIVEKNPGFRILGTGPLAVVADNHGAAFGGTCPANIVIDGSERRSINELTPSDIGAMEVYPAFANGIFAPDMYDKGCGAILIWTKR